MRLTAITFLPGEQTTVMVGSTTNVARVGENQPFHVMSELVAHGLVVPPQPLTSLDTRIVYHYIFLASANFPGLLLLCNNGFVWKDPQN